MAEVRLPRVLESRDMRISARGYGMLSVLRKEVIHHIYSESNPLRAWLVRAYSFWGRLFVVSMGNFVGGEFCIMLPMLIFCAILIKKGGF